MYDKSKGGLAHLSCCEKDGLGVTIFFVYKNIARKRVDKCR